MLKVKAHAKINWTLDIIGRRDDGYHLMDMLMQSVSIYDQLLLEEAETLILQGENIVHQHRGSSQISSQPVAYDETNIVWKAATVLQNAVNCHKGARITLKKEIPSGAGMGGGSADAAAALVGLNCLWNLQLPMEELEKIGLSLGADVPFMLNGGFARVQGIGERIEKIEPPQQYSMVLCKPCDGLSTGAVFKAYDSLSDTDEIKHPQNELFCEALKKGDVAQMRKSAGNVLQEISVIHRPEIQEAIDLMYDQDAMFSSMTGSGSVVFGIFEDMYSAAFAAKKLKEFYAGKNVWISWASTMNHPSFF